jgi:hypothetical protein
MRLVTTLEEGHGLLTGGGAALLVWRAAPRPSRNEYLPLSLIRMRILTSVGSRGGARDGAHPQPTLATTAGRLGR